MKIIAGIIMIIAWLFPVVATFVLFWLYDSGRIPYDKNKEEDRDNLIMYSFILFPICTGVTLALYFISLSLW